MIIHVQPVPTRLIITQAREEVLQSLLPCELLRLSLTREPAEEEIDITALCSAAKEFARGISSPARTLLDLTFRNERGYEYLRDSFAHLLTVTMFYFTEDNYSLLVGSFECISLGFDTKRLRRSSVCTCSLVGVGELSFSTTTLPARRRAVRRKTSARRS